jgi:hypothetical protein
MKSDIGVDDNDVKACPVTIAPGDDDALKRAKMGVSCAGCDACGKTQAVIVADTAAWSLLEPMWGLGCARECSRLKCKESRIWDWTRTPPACVDCSELRDSRLCLPSDFTDEKLENYVVSGHMALLYFEGCKGGAHELHEVTYGKCVKCEDSDKCADPTTYAAECRSRQVRCDFCARAGRGEVDVVRGQYAAKLGPDNNTMCPLIT